MKVTKENINDVPNVNEYQKKILLSLLDDVDTINANVEDDKKIFITCQDAHDDGENDWYGTFRIHFQSEPTETIGLEMAIDELDMALCVLINFLGLDS